MKIALAQIQSEAGAVDANINKHMDYIGKAAESGCKLIVFPELSITGYEPSLAGELAFTLPNSKLNVFQQASDQFNMNIAVGLPLKTSRGVQISMVVYHQRKPSTIYSKRYLHDDELPFFVKGESQTVFKIGERKFAPAICYESTLHRHADEVALHAPDVYTASVAKPAGGVKKANLHYPEIAVKYGMVVLMANAVGPADNFVNAGQSGVWTADGTLVASLGENEEGLLVYEL
ncbi:carbon-nitrogen hydrolase family protein [Phaeocystidibacter luteus]|uniref:Carbon-nitrogen hydrolase family protein n=1 Tax=Phaeocystidibacter luteus TaxID=911197 RepID=A0A6N6RKF7_9FLAO|nr:carbon-nitrogen hydrolase family protein [Phaeocystidibacter luteus]KAB2810065.1 carbon-nitrogen hydrolase family protein [Phaeocystidibacter luteus]